MLEYTAERNLTGGLRLAAHKERSTARPIAAGPIPRRLVLSCRQHRGAAAEPIVAPGERVLKGQTIARAGEAPSAANGTSSSKAGGSARQLIPSSLSPTPTPTC